MSSDEAREIAKGNPLSFLHVSKPEIDLPDTVDIHSKAVYEKGRENFSRMIAEGILRQDAAPAFYFYRQVMDGRAQTGLVAAASCDDYNRGVIKKHELTRPDKEDDRVNHIEFLNAQTGNVFLAHRAAADMEALTKEKTAGEPDVDFTAADGVRHSSWTVNDQESIGAITGIFERMPALYIADGHHRTAAAARVFASRKGAGESGYFMSVIFPHDQLRILPYNRVLQDLNGLSAGTLLARLNAVFEILPGGPERPARKHELAIYTDGIWRGLKFRPEIIGGARGIEGLDVSLLQQRILGPVFGIEDQRTSKRIQFIGGIRGTSELKRVVDNKEYACAFSMFPTSMEDLMAISDQGAIMPPKSTWFEPKLRDALFCRLL